MYTVMLAKCISTAQKIYQFWLSVIDIEILNRFDTTNIYQSLGIMLFNCFSPINNTVHTPGETCEKI